MVPAIGRATRPRVPRFRDNAFVTPETDESVPTEACLTSEENPRKVARTVEDGPCKIGTVEQANRDTKEHKLDTSLVVLILVRTPLRTPGRNVVCGRSTAFSSPARGNSIYALSVKARNGYPAHISCNHRLP